MQDTLSQFNCTTPFMEDKRMICTDPEKAKKALALYKKYQFGYEGQQCLKPCNYLRLKTIQTKEREYDGSDKAGKGYVQKKKVVRLSFYFEESVKKIQALYLYSFLSLIAEVGGYVGL